MLPKPTAEPTAAKIKPIFEAHSGLVEFVSTFYITLTFNLVYYYTIKNILTTNSRFRAYSLQLMVFGKILFHKIFQ
jgi:uncharacterized membrane protein